MGKGKPMGGSADLSCGRFDSAWEEYARSRAAGASVGPSPPPSKKHKGKKRSKKEHGDGGGHFHGAMKALLDAKHTSALAGAGDAVGVIAAQSIGEPSTQMTLNTFHHAGRGEANVTLGIPRLRELLMTATKDIKTPYIKVPFLPQVLDSDQAQELTSRLRKVSLMEILKRMTVTEKPLVWDDYSRLVVQQFTVTFSFHPLALYKDQAGLLLTREMITRCINADFVQKLKAKLKSFSKKGATFSLAAAQKSQVSTEEGALLDRDAHGGDAEMSTGNVDADATSAGGKSKNKKGQEGGRWKQEADAAMAEAGADEVGVKVMQGGGKAADRSRAFDICVEIQHESLRMIPMLELCEKVCMLCFVNLTSGVDFADDIKMEVTPKIQGLSTSRDPASWKPEAAMEKAGLLVQGRTGTLLQCLLDNSHVVDLPYLESNDIHMMQETFGIEAARRVLENEVIKVFGAYGIQVDPRHLSLVSDFMTHSGAFRGCNRTGTIPQFGSPLLQMSFETATQFLRKSVLYNTNDEMQSPSSNIACGQLVTTSGTGVCDLLVDTKKYLAG